MMTCTVCHGKEATKQVLVCLRVCMKNQRLVGHSSFHIDCLCRYSPDMVSDSKQHILWTLTNCVKSHLFLNRFFIPGWFFVCMYRIEYRSAVVDPGIDDFPLTWKYHA